MFFQRNWDTLKAKVINGVKLYFLIGNMPEGVNDTSIVLIPEVDYPETMKDFRPISLCTVIYKIIAKCLVYRLRLLLDDLISANLRVFVP
jgi:hypothetical protein